VWTVLNARHAGILDDAVVQSFEDAAPILKSTLYFAFMFVNLLGN
jgi:hypothetical protein